MTPKFDALIKRILLEMPLLKGAYTPELIDTDTETYEDRIQEILQMQSIGEFKNLVVYLDQTKSTDFYYFMNNKNYVAHVFVSKTIRPFSTDSLWKNKNFKNMISMTDLVLEFILPRYPYIQSSHYHTDEAKEFWTRTVSTALNNGHRCNIYDYATNTAQEISNIKTFQTEIENIWSDENKHPRIYQK